MSETAESIEFNLQVITPHGLVEDATVSIVTMPGEEGDFGVLPGHMPFLTKLKPGVINYESGKMPRKMAVSGGYVEVTREKVIVLARTCEKGEDIDIDRAKKAKLTLEDLLAGKSQDDNDREYIEGKIMRAIARLDVVGNINSPK
ncbi:ATP synthase epsilon chain [hydrothermal vent metagenome]|uniref:ATP synthase epsilon chain n=1 Tax=hydrothermal vent metagenome TaxID=652676 RepID=A0A3B1CVT9_9ZZZZ